MKMRLLLIVGLLATFSSCSKQLNYFTEDLYDDFRWSEDDLKRIQFYVSEDIRLVRINESGYSNIEDGQIQIRDDKKVEEVVIKRGTPGLLVFAQNSDRFAVSFDEDSDKFLMFGPNDKVNGRYVLLAKNWQKRGGVITYGNAMYKTGSQSAYAALMVDINSAKKSVKKSSTASGRKIN